MIWGFSHYFWKAIHCSFAVQKTPPPSWTASKNPSKNDGNGRGSDPASFLGWYIFRGELLNFQGLDKSNNPYNNYPSESTFRYYNKLLVGGWISTRLKKICSSIWIISLSRSINKKCLKPPSSKPMVAKTWRKIRLRSIIHKVGIFLPPSQ